MKETEGLRVTHSYVQYETEEERKRAREEAATKIYRVLSRGTLNDKKEEDLYTSLNRSS